MPEYAFTGQGGGGIPPNTQNSGSSVKDWIDTGLGVLDTLGGIFGWGNNKPNPEDHGKQGYTQHATQGYVAAEDAASGSQMSWFDQQHNIVGFTASGTVILIMGVAAYLVFFRKGGRSRGGF